MAARPSMSADGRFVAFTSWRATWCPATRTGPTDVFVHDRQTGGTTRVSVANGGPGEQRAAPRPLRGRALRRVPVLAPATSSPATPTAPQDVFVHDRQTGTTTHVSVATGGARPADSFSRR